ncbi:MAG: VOC family protein, partial [Thermoleophilia bacterium]
FAIDPEYTDQNATRMVNSDETSAMLLTEEFFRAIVWPQDVADTQATREVIVGLSAESRAEEDDLTERAIAAGAQSLGDPQDQGPMYMRGFRDLDGHQWSFIHMDMSAVG